MTVPRRGNVSSTPWECQFHAVELRVPAFGTRSSTLWDSQFQALELEVPSRIEPNALLKGRKGLKQEGGA